MRLDHIYNVLKFQVTSDMSVKPTTVALRALLVGGIAAFAKIARAAKASAV